MLKNGVKILLEAEMNEALRYERYDNTTQKTNYRNDKTKKKVRSNFGEIEISVPKDRNNKFEPQIVPKNSRDLSAIED